MSSNCFEGDTSEILRNFIENAKQSLWIATAFLDDYGAELLRKACERGVSIRLLISDRISENVLKPILRNLDCIEIKVFNEAFMHAKIYIADGKALIGSANLTQATLIGKNAESLCEIDTKEAIKSFNNLWKKAIPLSKTSNISEIKILILRAYSKGNI